MQSFFIGKAARRGVLAGWAAAGALGAACLAGPPARAQAPSEGSIAAGPTVAPALDELRSTLAGLHISKWKAPDAVRTDAQGNVDSLGRDLSGQLATLVDAANAAPASVPAAFAVYRNIDALYDVLLRVEGTAELAAPDREAGDLNHVLGSLQNARKALGENILNASTAQEASLRSLRAAAAAQAAQSAAAPAAAGGGTHVVSDGPAATAAHKPKPKPKPAAKPAPPANPPSQ